MAPEYQGMHFCNCMHHCGGGKSVSAKTFGRHFSYRTAIPLTLEEQLHHAAQSQSQSQHPKGRSRVTKGVRRVVKVLTKVKQTVKQKIWEKDTASGPSLEDSDVKLSHIHTSMAFIQQIKDVTLENSLLSSDAIECLRNPLQEVAQADCDLLLGFELFLSHSNASEDSYAKSCNVLSYAQVKKHLASFTGVHSIVYDMWPFSEYETCPHCQSPHYDPKKLASSNGQIKIPQQTFHTIPIGPQLQILHSHPETAKQMRYRVERTNEILEALKTGGGIIEDYDDVFHGAEYLRAVADGIISPNDICLLFSIDGAQLYTMKLSDCWIYIWIILDLNPNIRYKKIHILPGSFIPGPNKPKNIDSFLFKEGLCIPFLLLGMADGPAMAYLNGWNGHNATYGCHHKPNGSHYYPAISAPSDFPPNTCKHSEPCNHPIMAAKNNAQYKHIRQNTGISKPSIFSAITHILGVPSCFTADLMHLGALNLTDLFFGLFCGIMDCDKLDSKDLWDWAALIDNSVWKAHGKTVGDILPYLPGSFDRPPCNPAEKINSGYKAWEFLTYFYGYGPGHCIHCSQLILAHEQLLQFIVDFENLYYQQKTSRIHFVRQSIHLLSHLAAETVRLGPLCCMTQWPMERCIGEYGKEIHQPSCPYANLSQRGVISGQINALKALIPELGDAHDQTVPQGCLDLCGGYVLLKKLDDVDRSVSDTEHEAIMHYRSKHTNTPYLERFNYPVRKWARLRLPVGQIVCSAWREELKSLSQIRMSRFVKIHDHIEKDSVDFAEVKYFFRMIIETQLHVVAMISKFSRPDFQLLKESSGTLWSCKYEGDLSLYVVPIACIHSAVAMVPVPQFDENGLQFLPRTTDQYFVVEKMGLDVAFIGGFEDSVMDDVDT
ncbi:hypothetical protein ARMSODRAFT_990399 [Armillaria solidipes]|uniref:Uncharacterized protein n=1 Tax=Armillaria solidipes TaxID=1076256 RepID=A0A2H3B9N6_9AGAR|nr:hypothetical protein ARMSODRAFT_990399 [Armillaria solidipes]